MVLATGTDFEVFVEFLVEDHGATFGAFGPKALRDFFLFGFGAEPGFFCERGVVINGRRGDGRFGCVDAEGFLRE
jgi:hypothetical protein